MEVKGALSWAVLIVALSIGYYFVVYLPHQDTIKQTELKSEQDTKTHQEALANQQKCSEDGGQYYQKFYLANTNLSYSWDSPEYHYNSFLNTCLMYVRYIDLISNSKISEQYDQIIDVYSNKTILYGYFSRDVSTNPPTEDVGIWGNTFDGVPNFTSTKFYAQKDILFAQ